MAARETLVPNFLLARANAKINFRNGGSAEGSLARRGDRPFRLGHLEIFFGICSRLCSRILDNDKSRYQVESGKEGFAQLVVAGCNAPEVFDLVEEALDKVAIAVKFLVVREFFTPRANWRNYGLDSVI